MPDLGGFQRRRMIMKKKRSKGLKRFILLILLVIILVGAFFIGREILSHKRAQQQFQQLAKEIADDSSTGRNLSALFKKNNECIGWVCIKDTPIDYPVMHTPNDPKKYLYMNFEKEYSSSGTPFLDGRCNVDSDNCIIYGHNMRNGQLFASLKEYVDSKYCEKHPEIEFETAKGNNIYQIFAVVSLKESDEWYNFVDAPNRKNFKSNLSVLMKKALYTTGVRPKYGQKMITLSTCYGSGKDDRLIVVAVNTNSSL